MQQIQMHVFALLYLLILVIINKLIFKFIYADLLNMLFKYKHVCDR